MGPPSCSSSIFTDRPPSHFFLLRNQAGTVSMEFSALTHVTGRPEFREAGMLFWYTLLNMDNTDGLYCTMMDASRSPPVCNGHHYTLGSMADSAYEYMLKQWVLSDGEDQASGWPPTWRGGGFMLSFCLCLLTVSEGNEEGQRPLGLVFIPLLVWCGVCNRRW